MVGEPGAYVVESAITVRAGAGWTQDVEAAQSGLPSYVTFHAGNNWSVSLSTDSLGKPLDVGAYENAQRAPFTDPNRPGLAVSGDGRGCNEVGGSFRIHAIRLGGRPNDGRVVHIRATFEQLCEGKPPAVRGCLQYSEPGAGGGS
ncbi:MAG TPA: hypothetical protein VFS43_25630 [Polyangiaceae bacterium]|nr:hypothetical protein [Polyangiaceae bacterium]